MFASQKPLRQTVSLVEARLKDNSSVDPIKDLAFLSDHYVKKNEWDKANAATRHMLALAEGFSNSSFEITPLDIELQLNRKFLSGKNQGRNLLRFFFISILSLFILIIGLQLQEDPKFAFDLRAQLLALDPQSFVNRAEYHYSQGRLPEALADIDKALALNPKYSNALLRKSFYLYHQGHYLESLQVDELSDHKNQFYFWNKWRGESALGKYSSAAGTLQQAASTPDNLYEAAVTAARGGDYDKALKIAKLINVEAKNSHDKAEGFSQEARYFVKLSRYDEAIEAATRCIRISDDATYTSRAYIYRAEAKYHTARYEDAVTDASASIVLDQTFNYRAYKLRAACFEKLGRKVDAQADWRTADFEQNSRDL